MATTIGYTIVNNPTRANTIAYKRDGQWFPFLDTIVSLETVARLGEGAGFISHSEEDCQKRGIADEPMGTFEVIQSPSEIAEIDYEDRVILGLGQDSEGELVIYFEDIWYRFPLILSTPLGEIFSPEDAAKAIVEGMVRPMDASEKENLDVGYPRVVTHVLVYDRNKL